MSIFTSFHLHCFDLSSVLYHYVPFLLCAHFHSHGIILSSLHDVVITSYVLPHVPLSISPPVSSFLITVSHSAISLSPFPTYALQAILICSFLPFFFSGVTLNSTLVPQISQSQSAPSTRKIFMVSLGPFGKYSENPYIQQWTRLTRASPKVPVKR